MAKLIHFHFKAKNNVGDAAVVLAIRELVDKHTGGNRWTSEFLDQLRSPLSRRMISKINRNDLAVIGGGGLYSEHALPLDASALAAVKIPIVVFGAGYNEHLGGESLDEAQLQSLRELNERAALSSVRDEVSRKLLERLGFKVPVTGDPALFLASRKTALRLQAPPRIGLNLATHGWRLQDQYLPALLDTLTTVGEELRREYKAQLFYLVHTRAERKVARELRRRLPGLLVCHPSAPRLLYVYQQLDLVVSMMLHSSIFGLAAAVPVINVAYDRKNHAFMQSIGHPERCVDLDEATADRLLSLARNMLNADRSLMLADELRIRETWRMRSEEFVRKLSALLP